MDDATHDSFYDCLDAARGTLCSLSERACNYFELLAARHGLSSRHMPEKCPGTIPWYTLTWIRRAATRTCTEYGLTMTRVPGSQQVLDDVWSPLARWCQRLVR